MKLPAFSLWISGLLIVMSGVASAAPRPCCEIAAPTFEDGGVSETEQTSMRQHLVRYNFWLVTAERRTGAYLADVHVKILDDFGTVRFERTLDGPWLMIDLPPGRYTVEARFGLELQRRTVTLQARGHRELVLYFAADFDPSASAAIHEGRQ